MENEENKEEIKKKYLNPAKLGIKRLSQILKLWEQDGNTMPFTNWIAKFDIAYVALDWKIKENLIEPKLSFFTELPKKETYSMVLSSENFVRWLPLPTIWLGDWKGDKAYSLQEEEE